MIDTQKKNKPAVLIGNRRREKIFVAADDADGALKDPKKRRRLTLRSLFPEGHTSASNHPAHFQPATSKDERAPEWAGLDDSRGEFRLAVGDPSEILSQVKRRSLAWETRPASIFGVYFLAVNRRARSGALTTCV